VAAAFQARITTLTRPGTATATGALAVRGWRQDVVAPLVRIAVLAGFGGIDDVVDLARGHVVQHVVAAVVVAALAVVVHRVHRVAEQGVHVPLLRTVGMHLD